jgi:hypothetical protein
MAEMRWLISPRVMLPIGRLRQGGEEFSRQDALHFACGRRGGVAADGNQIVAEASSKGIGPGGSGCVPPLPLLFRRIDAVANPLQRLHGGAAGIFGQQRRIRADRETAQSAAHSKVQRP